MWRVSVQLVAGSPFFYSLHVCISSGIHLKLTRPKWKVEVKRTP
jgi:hypothetical protein